MKDIVVSVQDVSIRFNLASEKVDSIKEYIVKWIKRQVHFDEFYALRHVNLEIERGEAFAIVGENGCGKSTLLKAISGIYFPTAGTVTKSGNVAPLIELGAGFDMDLTARENIFLNGAVLGYSKEFMQEKFQEIMDFAELWDFIDIPIKNFSSGMIARLGFSIATMVTPDILIVDEILAVGDFLFQEKCERKIQAMLTEGTTLIFVSHSAEQVKKLCDRALWLVHGVPQLIGAADEVCNAYEAYMRGEIPLPNDETALKPEENTPDSPQPMPQVVTLGKKPQAQFVAWLRVLALLMVVYDHTVPFILKGMGVNWGPMNVVTTFLTQPFGIIQDFGFLGVCLFFLISGFLMTDTLLTLKSCKWLARRLGRILGAMIVSAAGLFCIQATIGTATGVPTYWAQFNLAQWIKSTFLIPYFTGQSDPIWGITWFLAPLILFYVWCALLQPTFQKAPKLYFTMVALMLILNMTALPRLGNIAYQIADHQSYLAILYLGQLFSSRQKKLISRKAFAGFLVLLTILCFAGNGVFYPGSFTGTEFRLPNIVYALFIFLLAYLMNSALPKNTVINWIGKISLPLYLCHLHVAQLLLPMLIPVAGTTVAMIITYIAIVLLALGESWLLHPIEQRIRKATE